LSYVSSKPPVLSDFYQEDSVLLILYFLGVVIMAGPVGTQKLIELLPTEIAGYRSDGRDEQADADGLFKLIDGGAEVYRALNVRQVFERRYVKKGDPDIIVYLFDMGTSADAYGAYHHDMREGPSAGIGPESEIQGSNLSFWKGSTYVSVVPLRQSNEVKERVLSIGRSVAGLIGSGGPPPDLVRLLPATGLNQHQIHYFHDWSLLSRLAFFPGDNSLRLGKETEGLLARYQLGSSDGGRAEGPALLLLRYPSSEQARAVSQDLAEGRVRLDSSEVIESRLVGRTVAAVLNAPSKLEAQKLLQQIPDLQGGRP
jgi:hypothetical protein